MIHMHQPLQPIIQHLFQVSSLEDVSRQRLESFVEEYPSFGIGHYLLSCKLRGEDHTLFQTETQRTSLYFSNPFWLQWLLDNSENAGGRTETAVETVHGMEPVQEPVVAEAVVNGEAAVAVEAMAVGPVAEAPAVESVAEVAAVEPVIEAPVEVQAPVVTAGEPEEPAVEEAVITEPENNVVTMAEEAYQVPETAATVEEAGPSAADQLLRSIEEAKELRDSLQKINEGLAEEPIRDEETPFVLEETETNHTPVEAGAAAVEAAPAGNPVVAAEIPVAASEVPAAAHTEPQQAEAHQSPTPAAEPALVFEPYHTIDYFASQGIKLTLEENPVDSLGKQLKSFTDWLKVMRRLPQKDKEVVPDRVAEQAIQSFAAHSIEGRDVVTETMAEVLAKQGMRERARVVYEKLSLLNPGKSAYFAAKIEQLNTR